MKPQSDLPGHRTDFWRKTGFATDPAVAHPVRRLLAAAIVVGASCSAFVFGQAKDPLDSSKVLELTTFATHSSASSPEAAIDLTHPRDGSGRIFVSTNEGRITPSPPAESPSKPSWISTRLKLPTLKRLWISQPMGLSYIAFHPDYARAGAPGEGKLYTFYKSRMPGTRAPDYSGAALATRPGDVLSQYVLLEWTVDRDDPNRIDTESLREVMRIEFSGPGPTVHSIGEISFNPFSRPGQPDYGNLYITAGDAFAGGALKNFQFVQDRNNPFGKVLRINPLQKGAPPFPSRRTIHSRMAGPCSTTTATWKRSSPGACAIPRTSASPGTPERDPA